VLSVGLKYFTLDQYLWVYALHFYFSRSGTSKVLGAKVTFGENKQFADNRLTVKSNAQNFKADYKFNIKLHNDYNIKRGENIFEMKVTELNSDVTYAKVHARFPDKVRYYSNQIYILYWHIFHKITTTYKYTLII
jgi:hypothetical protein